MSWFAAKEHCEGEGGKLVEIDSEEENLALVEEINKRGYVDRNMHFWIGLTDLKNDTAEEEDKNYEDDKDDEDDEDDGDDRDDGDWRLASSGLKPSYLNWHEGEPEEGGNEHCARLRTGNTSSWKDMWSDVDCNVHQIIQGTFPAPPQLVSLHALCEFDPSKENPSRVDASTDSEEGVYF